MTIQLAKYEGLGNDFLVFVDPDGAGQIDPPAVRALCDRRHGVGADGLLRLSPGRLHHLSGRLQDQLVDLVMELTNADGGPAETSGNGLRCAVAAAIDAKLLPDAAAGKVVRVLTGAGIAELELLEIGPGPRFEMAADMGKVSVSEQAQSPVAGWRAFAVDVGNPHLVLLAADTGGSEVDLAVLGPQLEHSRPGGVNVELVTVESGGSGCRMQVWERGAGLTLACGSGSCAAAAVVRAAGLAGDVVEVANPGGTLTVRLDGPPLAARARLEGPARRVARIEAELDSEVGA